MQWSLLSLITSRGAFQDDGRVVSLKKENTLINRSLNDLHEGLELEKIKKNQLEQYERREMLEISGIPVAQDEGCTDIV